MYSIEAQFAKVQDKHPLWSSYISFANTIKGRKLNRQILSKWFNRLVDKTDYAASEKKQVLAYLGSL